MAPRLGGYFCGPHLYNHNDIDPSAEDICIVCREPFTEERAICLASCGHIVGANGFRDWVRHHPNTCPYWNHSLGRTASSQSLLEWACNHKWFKNYEELIHMLMANGNNGSEFVASLNALHGDRLGIRDVMTILWNFWVKASFISAVLVTVTLVAVELASLALWTITALPTMFPLWLCSVRANDEFHAWIPFSSFVKFLKIVLILITSTGILAVATFMTIVFSVLVLSMWRSFAQSWAGKLLGMGSWSKSINQKNE